MFFYVIRRALTKNSTIEIRVVMNWFLVGFLWLWVKPKSFLIKTIQKFAQNKICIKFALA
jgi:hypothetical protein